MSVRWYHDSITWWVEEEQEHGDSQGALLSRALLTSRVLQVTPRSLKYFTRTSVVLSLVCTSQTHLQTWHTRLLAGTPLLLRFAPVASTRDFLTFPGAIVR